MIDIEAMAKNILDTRDGDHCEACKRPFDDCDDECLEGMKQWLTEQLKPLIDENEQLRAFAGGSEDCGSCFYSEADEDYPPCSTCRINNWREKDGDAIE